jgi:thiol-disulfide isomerase/thioredoxin
VNLILNPNYKFVIKGGLMMKLNKRKCTFITLGGIVVFILLGVLWSGKGLHYNNLPIISLEEFKSILDAKEDKIIYVYVGRDSCPTCNTIYPTLCSIGQSENINLLYYSTEPDREIRPEEMNDLLNDLKIERVPVVLQIEEGKIKKIYDGEEFVKMYV